MSTGIQTINWHFCTDWMVCFPKHATIVFFRITTPNLTQHRTNTPNQPVIRPFLSLIIFILSLRSSFSTCEPKKPPCHAILFPESEVVSVRNCTYEYFAPPYKSCSLSMDGTSSLSSLRSLIETNVPSNADAYAQRSFLECMFSS